ncbi:YihY/virulence factor BrkB family protein [Paraburkholderia phosphatilytica]|uniref:YihY/virulence factor BrkB family protein n=1 Tax=Paraburkholderia phosphatilytica TaxID=2282883 RepID=UPI000E4E4ADB|nr:YihY/virulence factor BrkB family protein [Paraburkholderia phosphatilytica]
MDMISSDKLQTAARHQASWAAGALKQFAANRCPAMAASIAFYAAFSLAPTLVMVIAVAGWFFGADAARGELYSEVHKVLGDEAAAGVTTIVQNAHNSGATGGIAAIVSFVMLAIGASATFSSLNSALNIVWPSVAPRSSSVMALVRVRLVSFGLVLGVAFLLIVSLVLDTAITFIGNWIWGNSPYVLIGDLMQLAVGVLVLAVAFAGLLKFLPDAPVRWRDALVGGVVAAVLFSVGKKLFALYLAHAGMANSFGAAGSLAVLMMWLYFSALVLLLAAEFSAARGRLHDPRGKWGLTDAAPPPGSRAKLASVIASATTRRATNGMAGTQLDGVVSSGVAAEPGAESGAVTSGNAAGASASSLVASSSTAANSAKAGGRSAGGLAAASFAALRRRHPLTFLRAPGAASATAASRPRVTAARVGRTIVRAEAQATKTAAAAIVGAGRRAAAADRYVKQHPWSSVLMAAGVALAVTHVAGRITGGHGGDAAAAANDDC